MKIQDKPIVPVNPILASERFENMRSGWLKWQREIFTQEVEKEKQETAKAIKSTSYYLPEEHSRMGSTFQIVSDKLEQMENDLRKSYGISKEFRYYENGSNPLDKNILKYAVEVYNKPKEWFQYGDLVDYIYALMNPDPKIMRVTKVDAQILATEAKKRGMTYGMDQVLVELAVEVLDFPTITHQTDLVELKDTKPDVLKLYRYLSLKNPEMKINNKNFFWSLNQVNKYWNTHEKLSMPKAFFEEIEDLRIFPPDLRTYEIRILIAPQLTKWDIEHVKNILEKSIDVGMSESYLRDVLKKLEENYKVELSQQSDVLELMNQEMYVATSKPAGDAKLEFLQERKLNEFYPDIPEYLGRNSFLRTVWIERERRRLVIPEKLKK